MLWPLLTYGILLLVMGAIFFLPQRRGAAKNAKKVVVVPQTGRHFQWWPMLFIIFAFLFWPIILLLTLKLHPLDQTPPAADLATMLMANGPLVLAYLALLLMRPFPKN